VFLKEIEQCDEKMAKSKHNQLCVKEDLEIKLQKLLKDQEAAKLVLTTFEVQVQHLKAK
jgi:hypothetical protein